MFNLGSAHFVSLTFSSVVVEVAECHWLSVVSGCHIAASSYMSGCPLSTNLRLNSYLLRGDVVAMANRGSWDAGETMSDASINDCKYHFHFHNVSRLLVWVVIGFRILLKEEQGSLLPWTPCLRHQDLKSCILTAIQKFNLLCASWIHHSLFHLSRPWCVCVAVGSLGEWRKYGAVAVCRLKQRGLKLFACHKVDEVPR